MNRTLPWIFFFLSFCGTLQAQQIGASPEYIKRLTAAWKGERSTDGRPRVTDSMLQRLKNISMEEAWQVLSNKGYTNQYEGDWIVIHPDSTMTGRVVTAQYMPARPDLEETIREQGKIEKRAQQGGTNSWPIDVLVNGDVYVADGCGKVVDGTLIGDNLGNAIYARSERGVIFYGSVRDQQGLSKIKGFNGWIKAQDPSYLKDMVLTSINTPIRIGKAIVMPGDAVLANKYGTIFIPSHLVNELVLTSEMTALRDEFGHLRLKEKKYTAGQIDSNWSNEIRKDFINWLGNYPGQLPMSKKELDDYLNSRNW